MRRWLLIDAPYLCHRAWYAMSGLTHGDLHTGVIYGFLRDIISLHDLFSPDAFIFCFDRGVSHRIDHCPTYKNNRKKGRSEEDVELYEHFEKQLLALQKEILPSIGFRNVISQKHYEADDCIGGLVAQYGRFKKIQHIIVSSDHDMYQLLSSNVRIYNPHKKETITAESFTEHWGIEPIQWIDVKAIAGCHSDCVPGIRGVGEKTACKFLQGQLKAGSAMFERIAMGNDLWKSNIKLVQLPYPGIDSFPVYERDRIKPRAWQEVINQYDMQSLSGMYPK